MLKGDMLMSFPRNYEVKELAVVKKRRNLAASNGGVRGMAGMALLWQRAEREYIRIPGALSSNTKEPPNH